MKFPSEGEYIAFEREMERKEKLFELFEKLEEDERKLKRQLPKRDRRYDRLINDHGEISQMGKDTIEWVRETGEKIRIMVGEDICQLLTLDDELSMTIGQRQNRWHLISINGIATEIGYTECIRCDEDEEQMVLDSTH